MFEAAELYQKEGVPLIILAGKKYGSGNSRDWAAKGPYLLVLILTFIFFFFFKFIYLFLKTECKRGRDGGWENPKQALSCQHRA